jgi:hypothetical protein
MTGDLGPTILYISSSSDRKVRIQRFLIKNRDYNEGFDRVHYLTPGISRQKMGEIANAFAGYFSGLFIDANRYKTQRDDGRKGNMSTDSRKSKE